MYVVRLKMTPFIFKENSCSDSKMAHSCLVLLCDLSWLILTYIGREERIIVVRTGVKKSGQTKKRKWEESRSRGGEVVMGVMDWRREEVEEERAEEEERGKGKGARSPFPATAVLWVILDRLSFQTDAQLFLYHLQPRCWHLEWSLTSRTPVFLIWVGEF